MEKIELRREAVIGYIVTQESGLDGLRYVNINPIIGDIDGFFDETLTNPISEDRQVIGVLPAQQNTFRVSGSLECRDGLFTKFGYEFAGANNPDWENECRDEVNTDAMIPKLWNIITNLSIEHGEASEEMILAAAMNIPLFEEWREYDVLTGEMRLHCMLKKMMVGGNLDSPRKGVYTLKRADRNRGAGGSANPVTCSGEEVTSN